MYDWVIYAVVFAVGFALGLLAKKGYISRRDVEKVKKELMKIPRDKIPHPYDLILEGAIIAMMIYTGEIPREEGEERLARIRRQLEGI